MDPLTIEGAWAYTPAIRCDARGSFFELFRGGEFLAALGYRLNVAQANCSVSRRGVIRGIHFADVPPGQAKYVSCLERRDPGCGGRPADRLPGLRAVGSGPAR